MSKQDTVTGQNHGANYCYYYLHTNGALLNKGKNCDISDFEESSFVKKWWIIDLDDRVDVYNMLIRASMLGIRKERLKELIEHWGITNEDAPNYLKRMGLMYKIDGDVYCVHSNTFINLQESNAGFGDTIFEAICEFIKIEVNASLIK